MAKSKSSSLNNMDPYKRREIERMRLAGEQSVEWETAKIIRKNGTVEVIRMKKA